MLALLVTVGLSFCVGAADLPGEPLLLKPQLPELTEGDLQVWSWNIAAASLNKLLPGFYEEYPKIKVSVSMSGTNLQSRFLLSLSAGVGAPEISQLQLAEATRYSRTFKLADLTEVALEYGNCFPESFWSNCLLEVKTEAGTQMKLFAIPWDMGPCAVFYKRKVFEQCGVDPESIVTWDDYIAAGRQIVERSGGATKIMPLPTAGLHDMFEILLQQAGGQVFDAKGRVAINSPETAAVIDVFRKLLTSGVTTNITPNGHAYYASIKSDTVASFPAAAWFGGTIKDYAPDMAGQWGVFRLPGITADGLRTSNLGGSVLVIPDQCKQKDAAWRFIQYALCTPRAQLEQYRNYDLFPALLVTHRDPFFDEPDPYFGGQKARRLFATDIEKIPALNRTQDWFQALRYIQQALSKWVTDGMGPSDELLASLEDRLCRRLGREPVPHGG